MSRIRAGIISMAMVMLGSAGLVALAPQPATAASCPNGQARLLTFPAWYNGLVRDNCEMKKFENTDGYLRNFIFRIILNVVEMILQLVAYATVVFLILGGFNYMTAAGDPSKIAGAKKTITNAIVGLVVALLSVGIVNLVAGAL